MGNKEKQTVMCLSEKLLCALAQTCTTTCLKLCWRDSCKLFFHLVFKWWWRALACQPGISPLDWDLVGSPWQIIHTILILIKLVMIPLSCLNGILSSWKSPFLSGSGNSPLNPAKNNDPHSLYHDSVLCNAFLRWRWWIAGCCCWIPFFLGLHLQGNLNIRVI